MANKRCRPEEIITKLRGADILISQGDAVAVTIRKLGISDVTYYQWRKEYGGMQASQVKRLKALEKENSRP
jgi:putative transposase